MFIAIDASLDYLNLVGGLRNLNLNSFITINITMENKGKKGAKAAVTADKERKPRSTTKSADKPKSASKS